MSAEASDPTGAGALLPSGQGALRLSVGEVEALCFKAARGAGMEWGLAEEAGFAAGWLAAQGLDGAGLVCALLDATQGVPRHDMTPQAGEWQAAPGQVLCPINLGTALCDHAGLPGGLAAATIITGPVAWPVLVLPFAARIAAAHQTGITLDWPGCRLAIGPRPGRVGPKQAALLCSRSAALTLAPMPPTSTEPAPDAPRPATPREALHRLEAFAMKTTVPASEQSRAGAGAGTTDND